MKKVAILASDNMMPGHANEREDSFERDEQMGKLVPAFAAEGLALDLIRWRDAASLASLYDAMLPLFVWDYFEGNDEAFTAEMAQAAQHTSLYNPFDVLRWNLEKSYLQDLEKSGAPVIETLTLERVTQSGIERAFETLKTDKLVIKPLIGGGAWRQALYKKGDPFPDKNSLPPGAAMVQAFLPSVQAEGEYSFLYFGGKFSHALIKKPKSGDYRIQSLYGGYEEAYIPTNSERATARAVLDSLEYTPLYARVDLLRGLDGHLKLIELEMVEPYLYLSYAEGEGGENQGAQKLAAALARRLAS